jgi:dTDP-4-amino-4,6-dideoxygalactose transaminase
MPIHLQPYYRRLGFKPGHCPEAEEYARHCLSLPMYADLNEAQQDRVVEALRAALRE